MMNKRCVGTHYEDIAVDYLEKRGMKVVSRNFRRRIGEIDIIAMDGDTLVFIEVKYRSTGDFGSPGAAVGAAKQKTIRKMAQMYMNASHLPEETCCRFDVIGIYGDGRIEHIENAFGGLA